MEEVISPKPGTIGGQFTTRRRHAVARRELLGKFYCGQSLGTRMDALNMAERAIDWRCTGDTIRKTKREDIW